MDDREYLIMAASESRGCASQWFRYLNKVMVRRGGSIDPALAAALMDGPELTNFQKVSLDRACAQGSPTQAYVAGLSRPARTRNLDKLKEMVRDGLV